MEKVELNQGFLERWGIQVIYKDFNKIRKQFILADIDRFYENSKSIIYFATILSFFIGLIPTAIIVYIESSFSHETIPWSNPFYEKWTWIISALGIFTFLEFYFLYRVGFYSVAKLACLSGMSIDDDPIILTKNKNILARMVLEIPDHRLKLLGVDPYKRLNKKGLFFRTILYKSKVFLSNYAAKLIFRKILSRTTLRVYAEYIIAPVTGVWDALITYYILEKMKIRLFTRNLTELYFEHFLETAETMDNEVIDLNIRAIANAVVLDKKFHPNLEYLLLKMYDRFEDRINKNDPIDDWDNFLIRVDNLSQDKQLKVLKTFNLCLSMIGKLSKYEKNAINDSKLLSSKENIQNIQTLIGLMQEGNFSKLKEQILSI
ncbi:LBF_2804 family protein [Leptospira sp. GIMC2001]|uniref:LBF_2804 family protein n=1 Tax=Leptospira sp. GIMC2001 TaxID=1513297 RepID=UPI002349656D|nr:hypothetical protein [Leptospira sp. GIMC2001]WCL50971.1 hypothetical protein O4O04_09210 [Leptospira sp. GIMC2001]